MTTHFKYSFRGFGLSFLVGISLLASASSSNFPSRLDTAHVKVSSKFADDIQQTYNNSLLMVAAQRGRLVSCTFNAQLTVTLGDTTAAFNGSGSRSIDVSIGNQPYTITGESSYTIKWIPAKSNRTLTVDKDEVYNGSGSFNLGQDQAGREIGTTVVLSDRQLNAVGIHRHHGNMGFSYTASLSGGSSQGSATSSAPNDVALSVSELPQKWTQMSGSDSQSLFTQSSLAAPPPGAKIDGWKSEADGGATILLAELNTPDRSTPSKSQIESTMQQAIQKIRDAYSAKGIQVSIEGPEPINLSAITGSYITVRASIGDQNLEQITCLFDSLHRPGKVFSLSIVARAERSADIRKDAWSLVVKRASR